MKILKLSNGGNIRLEDYETDGILESIQNKETRVFKNGVANLTYFVALVEESDEIYDKKNQKTGVLHDGTKVVKHFGLWYTDGLFDEKGNPYQRVDPCYYQEVARECVPNPQEYHKKYIHLPQKERLKQILQGSSTPRRKEINTVKEALSNSIKRLEKNK